MKFGSRTNKRSDIPSFREFLNQEKILRESGIIDNEDSEIHQNASQILKEKNKTKSKSSNLNNDNKDSQIKAISIENYKLIKENGLLKEELENLKKI